MVKFEDNINNPNLMNFTSLSRGLSRKNKLSTIHGREMGLKVRNISDPQMCRFSQQMAPPPPPPSFTTPPYPLHPTKLHLFTQSLPRLLSLHSIDISHNAS